MAQPADRLYTKDHEWVKIEGSAATIGITDHAQSSLGDIVYVELPRIGAVLAELRGIDPGSLAAATTANAFAAMPRLAALRGTAVT